MKKSVIFLLFATMLAITGCDFFRMVAGRPVSADIERKRMEIMKAEEAALQAYLDSVKMVKEKIVADSLAALDTVKAYGLMMNGPSLLGGLSEDTLALRYHVVIGAFKTRSNAEKLAARAEEKGYETELIDFRRGMVAVGVCASDRIVETVSEFRKLRAESFCPAGAWILVNE